MTTNIYILNDGKSYLEKYIYRNAECSKAIDKAKRKAVGIGTIGKKYKIELVDMPCTEVEKELVYECEKYIPFSKMKI